MPTAPAFATRGRQPVTPTSTAGGRLPAAPASIARGRLPAASTSATMGGLRAAPTSAAMGGLPAAPTSTAKGGLPAAPTFTAWGCLSCIAWGYLSPAPPRADKPATPRAAKPATPGAAKPPSPGEAGSPSPGETCSPLSGEACSPSLGRPVRHRLVSPVRRHLGLPCSPSPGVARELLPGDACPGDRLLLTSRDFLGLEEPAGGPLMALLTAFPLTALSLSASPLSRELLMGPLKPHFLAQDYDWDCWVFEGGGTAVISKGSSQSMGECTHEEVDTRIVVHLSYSLKTGNNKILLRTVDTDVIVILIGQMFNLLSSYPVMDLCVVFGMGLENIPPTQDALLQHINRVAYQGGIWTISTEPQAKIPTPEGWGWTTTGGLSG
ncbi:UNVERIFIED_CONTAM: hypothetical protein FKN15_074809 [Acipenser sinensis]